MTPSNFSVLLAEDHQLFRTMLKELIKINYPNSIVKEAANGQKAIDLIKSETFDLIMMDINMPEINGLEAISLIREMDIVQPKILVLSFHQTPLVANDAMSRGADGYTIKDTDSEDLFRAVKLIMQGDQYVHPSVKGTYLHQFAKGGNTPLISGADLLTTQENKILHFICKGITNEEIAEQLDITVATVVKHKMNIRKRIGSKSLIEYVKFALLYKIISKEELHEL